MKKVTLFFAVVVCLAISTGTFAQKTVSIETLLKEMVDRNERAKFPEPAFTCKQFSSYDRETVAKDKPGWFANADRSQFIRIEKSNGRTEYVMMDTEGPGAIVRFWMTFAGKDAGRGIMRIYIDDYSKPIIEGSAMDILSGNLITTAPLAASVSELSPYENRGHNLYFPIPYKKQCKITYESENLFEDDLGAKRRGTEAVYYNINYRTYEAATNVISYSATEMKKNKALITKAQNQLKNKERGIEKMKLSRLSLNSNLSAGGKKSFIISGSNAIQQLSMNVQAENREQALRSTVLEISFDGERTVWAPIGDFYGIGYMPIYTNTWYTRAEKGGIMDAYWVMPFEKECAITIHNLGNQDVVVSDAFAGYNKWTWDARSMHFGTTWQQYTHVFGGSADEALDLNFANLKGKGVYVGDGVALFNTARSWWGEGDEKIYVDGETFPSHIGTGSEDYYGYAWSRPEVFTDHPFIAQPLGEGSFLPGYTFNNRVRALDGIPFSSSIYVDLELWHASKTRINYAPVSFWYMIPGGEKLTPEDISGAKEPVAMKRSDIFSPKLQFTIEAENLIVEKISNTRYGYQTHEPFWDGGMQFFWREIDKGNSVVFEFESDFSGQYDFSCIFTIAPNYGTFNVSLNDKLLVSNLDLYNPKVEVKEVKLGKISLNQGKNVLSIELTGLPKGSEKSSLGLDKLIFRK
jgi:Protein of unknown function (DUF2961).